MNDIIAYLGKRGFRTVEESYYAHIKDWFDWYRNGVDEWHNRTFYNGIQTVKKVIKSLGMAKTISETWANLLMNEKVEISTGSETSDKTLQEILKDNNFLVQANRLVELYCALGTGAFVEYLSESEIRIDYVQADMIYPLSWDSRGIHECAFGSRVHTQQGDCILLQIHTKQGKNYKIENLLIQDDENGGFKELPLPEGVARTVSTGTDKPCFQIVSPNINNKIDLKNPMGISVYANAIDCLKEVDTTFDALDNEIETGRRMVFLASEMFFSDANGNQRNVIGENETILRFIGSVDDGENTLIHDYSPALRVNDVKEALQFQLNLLSEKCGMGTNQFEFTTKGVKTATEVISEDSDLYQTLRKHELVLESALISMVEALAYLGSKVGKGFETPEISINFDDSIIEDKVAERQQDMTDLANGTLRHEEYRAKWRNESIEEALANLPKEADVMP